jgi:hypothetical protein
VLLLLLLCPSQVLTGLGPVSQVSVSTGLPRFAVQVLLAAFVLHGLYGFSPSTPTWSAQNRNVGASCWPDRDVCCACSEGGVHT